MKLSYDEMKLVLDQGGSVLHQGVVISDLKQLPSKADVARGDKDAEQAARDSYRDQIAHLQMEMSKLHDDHPERPATGTETADKGALVNDPPLVQQTPETMKEAREAAGFEEPAKQAHPQHGRK